MLLSRHIIPCYNKFIILFTKIFVQIEGIQLNESKRIQKNIYPKKKRKEKKNSVKILLIYILRKLTNNRVKSPVQLPSIILCSINPTSLRCHLNDAVMLCVAFVWYFGVTKPEKSEFTAKTNVYNEKKIVQISPLVVHIKLIQEKTPVPYQDV